MESSYTLKFEPGDPRLEQIKAALSSEPTGTPYNSFLQKLMDYGCNGVDIVTLYKDPDIYSVEQRYVVLILHSQSENEWLEVQFDVQRSDWRHGYRMTGLRMQVKHSPSSKRVGIAAGAGKPETGLWTWSDVDIDIEDICALYLATHYSETLRYYGSLWKEKLGVEVSVIENIMR